MGFSRQTLSGARFLPPVTIRELPIGAAKTNGQQCLNNSLTPSFSAWGRRCETCLAVRRDHIPLLKTGYFLLERHHSSLFFQSCCAASFYQSSFFYP
ncbi:hypothetical protein TNCV_3662631 [Trichonephila clavipes]|nr:hypothetical protein TNCV_3662631 [Trichonephila clavipes]